MTQPVSQKPQTMPETAAASKPTARPRPEGPKPAGMDYQLGFTSGPGA